MKITYITNNNDLSEQFSMNTAAAAVSLVNSIDDVNTNIHRYNGALNTPAGRDLKARMPAARAWYAIREKGQVYFGPSKFIGYNGMDARYYTKHSESLDGRMTESRIGEWATPIPRTHVLYDELYESLKDFCATHGASPNKLARISLIGGDVSESGLPSEDETVYALSVLINNLSDAGKKKLKQLF